jgi:hypothetical protein
MATKPKASPTDPPDGVPAKELDRLFHGPVEEFTPARNELAKSLRSDGIREAADWVKALKKPTRAAWLVNQLAARKPKEVARLLEVGAELRRGQEEMLAGSADREALRKAARREQEVVDKLVRTAEAIGREHEVGSKKLSSQVLDRVTETLRAAPSDPEVARAIELGRLEREQRAVSIGLTGAALPAPAKGKRAKDEAAARRARQETARRRKAAEREVASAEKRLERAEAAAERAREALEEKEKALRDAEHDLRAARNALQDV